MEALLKTLKEADQLQVSAHVDTLNEEEKAEFVKNCTLDYQNLTNIFKLSTTAKKEFKNIKPLPCTQFASTITSSKEQVQKWHKLGMDAISLNKVAVILLAGGQGTRLGSSDPKGLLL
jgi:UDP-N-acetylglucosamine/UDP-N-acetylgalactosamine diphosphorylase